MPGRQEPIKKLDFVDLSGSDGSEYKMVTLCNVYNSGVTSECE